jgi:hypothetical protein
LLTQQGTGPQGLSVWTGCKRHVCFSVCGLAPTTESAVYC